MYDIYLIAYIYFYMYSICTNTMSFLGIGRKKGHVADDNARAMSLQARRDNAELKRMEFEIKKMDLEVEKLRREAEIQDMRAELYGDEDEEDDLESKLMAIITPMLMQRMNLSELPIPTPETPKEEPKTLSDEEISDLLEKIPKQARNAIKGMPEEEAVKLGKDKFPMLSESTLRRAWHILQS
jgi:hypothetical protein